jgi:hypothetical protein
MCSAIRTVNNKTRKENMRTYLKITCFVNCAVGKGGRAKRVGKRMQATAVGFVY